MGSGFDISVHMHEPTINVKVHVDPIELRVVFPTVEAPPHHPHHPGHIAWEVGPVSDRSLD